MYTVYMGQALRQSECQPPERREEEMYSKVLIPLDGSPLAERAIDHAIEISRGTGAEIILLQVVHDPLAALPEAGQAAETLVTGEAVSSAMAYLSGIASRLEGTTVRCEVIEGEPAASILDLAHRENVDVIVMSTHGRSGLTKAVMGSVAEKVAMTTKRPVMLVKPERVPKPPRVDEADVFLSAP
jgi:nucleotide-binding universal stress UspA family protein